MREWGDTIWKSDDHTGERAKLCSTSPLHGKGAPFSLILACNHGAFRQRNRKTTGPTTTRRFTSRVLPSTFGRFG